MTDWVMKSIEPKSDQLNADDLIAGAVVVTVKDVKRGSVEQPIVLEIDGGRQPYKPCKSMRRLLVMMWGNEPKAWIGKRLRLFNDPNVQWGGVKVGGIRIDAMSDIPQTTKVMMTVSRGKRIEYSVDPLTGETAKPELSRAQKAIEAIENAKDESTLEKYQLRLEQTWDEFTADERKQLKAALERASKPKG